MSSDAQLRLHPELSIGKPANVVVVGGWHSVVVADHRLGLWPCYRSWIRRRKYAGVDVLRTLNVSRATLYSIVCWTGSQCKILNNRLASGSSWRLENDPSCVVLHTLQLLDAVSWSAVQHSIAIVDPGQDQTTRQRLCQFRIFSRCRMCRMACAW